MMGKLLPVFLVLALMGTVPAKAETAEPFQLYTAYSKDSLSPDQYGDKVIVVFHGFLSAMPNGFYKAFQKKLGDDYTVLGYTYEYFDIDRTIAEFDAFHASYLKGKTVFYAGSSLGGFWADYFGARHNVTGVMASNPLVDPRTAANLFIGTQHSEKRQIDVTVTAEDIARYDALSLDPSAEVERLIVLTHDDSHSDPLATFAAYKENPMATVVMLSTGGHTLNYRKHFVWGMVEAWLRR